MQIFVFGMLLHGPLRRAVLGEDAPARPARLPDHAVRRAAQAGTPVLLPCAGEVAHGLLLSPSAAALARMDAYEGLFGYARAPLTVEAEGPVAAEHYRPKGAAPQSAGPWDLAGWVAARGRLDTAVAEQALAELAAGQPAERVAARMDPIATRVQARLNAEDVAPATLRRAGAPEDVEVLGYRVPYAAFFSLEEYDLRHRSFAGGMGPVLKRAAFVSGDAVTVLPYDPVRDRVLLVEQFRAGPFARGDSRPWKLEAIAGRIDGGESPDEAARREAQEEARIALGELILMARYYPSPGAKTEFLYSYVALGDLPDQAAGLGGAEDEGEDIRSHVIPYADMMALIDSGEIDNGPLLITALALAARRDTLRR